MEPELCATPDGAVAAMIDRQKNGPQRIGLKIVEGYRFYEVSDYQGEADE